MMPKGCNWKSPHSGKDAEEYGGVQNLDSRLNCRIGVLIYFSASALLAIIVQPRYFLFQGKCEHVTCSCRWHLYEFFLYYRWFKIYKK